MFSSYIAGGNSFLHLQWRTKRIKVSESPPPNHVISFIRQYAVTWSTDFWATMFPQNIRRTQMFPHFLLWFLFPSILFSLLRLLFLTFSGAPDITYAIHTCTHAQNIILIMTLSGDRVIGWSGAWFYNTVKNKFNCNSVYRVHIVTVTIS